MDIRFEVVQPASHAGATCVWFVDAPEHAFDLAALGAGRGLAIVQVFVNNWEHALTPWPAPALFRGQEDFGGAAAETLEALIEGGPGATSTPAGLDGVTHHAIAGYSLAGLFSLWSWVVRPDVFAACGCLSGSLWYEGWCDWLSTRAAQGELLGTGRFAYLTLGTKEKRAARPQMKRVEECAQRTEELLRAAGAEVSFELTPGGHFDHADDRVSAGLAALDEWLGGIN